MAKKSNKKKANRKQQEEQNSLQDPVNTAATTLPQKTPLPQIPQPLPFKCQPCNIQLDSADDATQHAIISHNGSVHTCQRCRLMFDCRDQLSAHLKASNQHWKCHVYNDDMDYDSLKQFRRHNAEVHFQCFCGHAGNSADGLQQHKVDKHYLRCFGCEEKFRWPADVLFHLETEDCASGIRRVDIETFALEYPLSYLIDNRQNVARPWRCTRCPRECQSLNLLLRHTASPHCDESLAPGSLLAGLLDYIEGRIVARVVRTEEQEEVEFIVE